MLSSQHSLHCTAGSHRRSPLGTVCTAHQALMSDLGTLCTAQRALIGDLLLALSALHSRLSPALSSRHCLHCTAGSDQHSLLGTVCTAQQTLIGTLFHSAVAVVSRPAVSGSLGPRDHSTPDDDGASAPPAVCPSSCRFFQGCHPAIPSSDGPLPLLPSVFPSIKDVYTMCKTEAIIQNINSVYMPAPISRFPPPPFPLFGVHTFILFVLFICVSISAL